MSYFKRTSTGEKVFVRTGKCYEGYPVNVWLRDGRLDLLAEQDLEPWVDPPATELSEYDRTFRDSISPWQLRKWLNANQMRQSIEDYITATNDQDVMDGWEFATEFRRDNPLVVAAATAFAPQFEMTVEDFIHKLFWDASQL